MAFSYVPSAFPHLRQGEIIENLFELKPVVSPEAIISVEQTTKLEKFDHPFVITVSQDCDLKWDYEARQGRVQEDKVLTHVLFCDLYTEEEVRIRNRLKSDIFKRVKRNQDERYHHLDQAIVGETGQSLPELYADFKATFSLPTEFVYWLTLNGQASRRGALPSPYLEDFMHRLYGFLGRVATPEVVDDPLM